MEFQSTLSLRRATPVEDDPVSVRAISIHALLAESDPGRLGRVGAWSHFNPRSPCGERRVFAPRCLVSGYFNPRSPCGERPSVSSSHLLEQIFQSTLSLRRATIPPNRERGGDHIFQSTLSLRRATRRRNDRRGSHLISIHALLAESDDSARLASLSKSEFQSTLSLRRATIPPGLHHFPNRNFNPRSPCGERPGPLTGPAPLRYFNPRSPCGERPGPMVRLNSTITFQSTLSLRRATGQPICDF